MDSLWIKPVNLEDLKIEETEVLLEFATEKRYEDDILEILDSSNHMGFKDKRLNRFNKLEVSRSHIQELIRKFNIEVHKNITMLEFIEREWYTKHYADYFSDQLRINGNFDFNRNAITKFGWERRKVVVTGWNRHKRITCTSTHVFNWEDFDEEYDDEEYTTASDVPYYVKV